MRLARVLVEGMAFVVGVGALIRLQQRGVTVDSIARAKAAQQQDRDRVFQETGILVNDKGQLQIKEAVNQGGRG